jgi:hypothetical protein
VAERGLVAGERAIDDDLVPPHRNPPDLAAVEARVDAVEQASAHRHSTPIVRELTPHEVERQRGLVVLSLLAPRRSSGRLDGRQAAGF